MSLSLIALATALAKGGSFVSHAAGGSIVTGATGYAAGTYVAKQAVKTALVGSAAPTGFGILLWMLLN